MTIHAAEKLEQLLVERRVVRFAGVVGAPASRPSASAANVSTS